MLCGITATPPNKDIHKTALGATESVEWEYEKDTVETILKLRKRKYNVVTELCYGVSLNYYLYCSLLYVINA